VEVPAGYAWQLAHAADAPLPGEAVHTTTVRTEPTREEHSPRLIEAPGELAAPIELQVSWLSHMFARCQESTQVPKFVKS
jgi:hypothetical protein